MPESKATKVLNRLVERNPDADPDDLKAAFLEQVMVDKELRRAIVKEFAEALYPIVEKQAKGERLTKEEQAFADQIDGKPLSKARERMAQEFWDRMTAAKVR